ncbi:hypothetical protein CDV31_010735 [Fusarium ambrosium]|uniref:Uncharacterized protein n=1 Tax=Fusarium ambrosium TaxID=131363 RepID=A0A428TL49_9HYPO|nr:hypothetical protein CDV31_010735 [Fusarium ambrosium]
MDEDTDYYRILEIDDSADEATVKQAVKAIMDAWHGSIILTRSRVTGMPLQGSRRFNMPLIFYLMMRNAKSTTRGGEGAEGRQPPVTQQPVRSEKLSSSGIHNINMTGNADSRSMNVDERKNNGESNKNKERNKRGVNEKRNAGVPLPLSRDYLGVKSGLSFVTNNARHSELH